MRRVSRRAGFSWFICNGLKKKVTNIGERDGILEKNLYICGVRDTNMARHKHKNPRVKVYFRHKGHYFKLLEAINFGSKSTPELKIKGLAETYMQIKDEQKRFDGNIHEGQWIRLVDGRHQEFTYHKDGSILSEVIQPSGDKEYDNPYGKGERWTPMAEIKTFQPVMVLQIMSMAQYRQVFLEEKHGLINYVVKNDRLFEFTKGQGMLVLVYLKHKDYPLARYCFDDKIYSDVLMKLGESLELCVFIQKQMHPDNVDTMLKNNYVFVDRLDGFEYLDSVLREHIFDRTFVAFWNIIQEGGHYFDVSEKMMQVIESVDPLYKALIGKEAPIDVHKPMLVRRLLDTLDGKYDGYLGLSDEDRLKRVIALYAEMLAEVKGNGGVRDEYGSN